MSRYRLRSAVVSLAVLLAHPASVAAQSASGSSLRSYVSVLVAFAISWIVVAAWVARIGSKVNRLLDRRVDPTTE